MKAQESQFLPFLNGARQFVIPIYQRTYSWTYEQCEQLWNDIVQTALGRDQEGHFIGSIVYVQQGMVIITSIPQYLVIDGQQRMTTLSLLLIAVAKSLQNSSIPQRISFEQIYNSYLVNPYGQGKQRYKLLLTQSDKDALIDIIDHPECIVPGQARNRLEENYLFFLERMQRSEIDLGTLCAGISKLIIVEIMLGRDDNPQLIFESLNSTGMDLSQADLIRNYVLMGLRAEEQERLYNDYWYPMEQQFRYAEGTDEFDRFMRDYLTMKQGSIPNIDRVYVSFKAYQRSKTDVPIQEIVADIYRYACHFVKTALLQEQDKDILEALKDINTLKVDVAYPFLLEVYDNYVQKLLSKKDLVATLRLIESYVLRRLICGIQTKPLNKIFAVLAKDIDKKHYLESVQAAFLAKTGISRFPRDEEFKPAFVVKDIYNLRVRKYLLGKLENHDQKALITIDTCTIEHIMPQNEHLSAAWQAELGPNWQDIQARYIHTIGNLTLTHHNSELGDRPFTEKRDLLKGGFATIPLRLSKSLGFLEHWNKDEIEKRAQELAYIAVKIWAMPQLSTEQVKQYNALMQQIPYEIVGPVLLPLVGFVPAGFKIIRRSEKRFHLFQLIGNNWIQYGNGKKAWYAISWLWAGEWAREKQQKNEIPLGIGGDIVHSTPTSKTMSGIILDPPNGEDGDSSNGYTLEIYPYLQGAMLNLFEQVRIRILSLDQSVRQEYKKLYIAYKLDTNFVDIEPQAKRLRLSLNMKFSEINDPKGMCKNISHVSHWGNGEVEVGLSSTDQLDDVMNLVRQSFDKHYEEDEV